MQTPCHLSSDADDLRVWITGNHVEAKQIANRHFRDAVRPRVGPIDCAVIAARSTDEAVYFASKVQRRLVVQGTLWIMLDDSCEDTDAAGGATKELESRLTVHGYRLRQTATPYHGLVCIAFARFA